MEPTADSFEAPPPGKGSRGNHDFVINTVRWLDARPEELTDVCLEPELLDQWCSSVFMDGKVVDRGGIDGLGMTLHLHVKGFMPHSFFIAVKIIDVVRHHWMRVAVSGDLEGVGDVTLVRDGDGCQFLLDWRMSFGRPWMRPLARVFHGAFVRNHKWAMNRACRLVVVEVHRRREAEGGQIVRTRATFPHNLPMYGAWRRRSASARRRPLDWR
ncbi:MAG: hypothetical protein WAL26_03325 [Mycobacterium sp.]